MNLKGLFVTQRFLGCSFDTSQLIVFLMMLKYSTLQV